MKTVVLFIGLSVSSLMTAQVFTPAVLSFGCSSAVN